MIDASFWRGRRVLVTGHTGFKGAWLALWLGRLGAKIFGLALPPPTEPSLFALLALGGRLTHIELDICDAEAIGAAVRRIEPEIVFHLAAQSLVRAGYRDPVGTFATNVQGTANLLEALRGTSSVRVAVCVTTDKVYCDRGWSYPYREEDTLGGRDPYSASKAASELVIASYRDAFLAAQGVAVASARAGNVIGGGDWSADRLIPDAVRAWMAGEALILRNPRAVRPWQHVLEPLHGYLVLAQALWHRPELAGAWNFGPRPHEAATVLEVVELARAAFGGGEIVLGDQVSGPHETAWLSLETAKTRTMLGQRPRWTLVEAIERTMGWYRGWREGTSPEALCHGDIAAFEAARGTEGAPCPA